MRRTLPTAFAGAILADMRPSDRKRIGRAVQARDRAALNRALYQAATPRQRDLVDRALAGDAVAVARWDREDRRAACGLAPWSGPGSRHGAPCDLYGRRAPTAPGKPSRRAKHGKALRRDAAQRRADRVAETALDARTLESALAVGQITRRQAKRMLRTARYRVRGIAVGTVASATVPAIGPGGPSARHCAGFSTDKTTSRGRQIPRIV